MTADLHVDLGARVRAAAAALAAAGVPSARHDAEELAAHVLGLPRRLLTTALATSVAMPAAMSEDQAGRYADLVARRAGREPLQHLLGWAGFRRLVLALGPGTFVPRPETELVAGAAIELLTGALATRPAPVVVDLCSGPGTIALSIAQEVPRSLVHAVEVDPDAHAWARRNAAARVAAGDPPVELHLADARTALSGLAGRVDLVVSNPPYLSVADRPRLDPEVRDHDPGVALWGGPDGLDVMRPVVASAARLLRPGGYLVLEHADTQRAAVLGLLGAGGAWESVADHRDLAGRDRYATARRRPATGAG